MTLQSPPAFLQAGSYSALSDRLHLITATALRDSPAGHRARQGFYADRSPLYANPSAMNWTIGLCAGVIATTFLLWPKPQNHTCRERNRRCGCLV